MKRKINHISVTSAAYGSKGKKLVLVMGKVVSVYCRVAVANRRSVRSERLASNVVEIPATHTHTHIYLHIYAMHRHALELLQVWFQTTTVKLVFARKGVIIFCW